MSFEKLVKITFEKLGWSTERACEIIVETWVGETFLLVIHFVDEGFAGDDAVPYSRSRRIERSVESGVILAETDQCGVAPASHQRIVPAFGNEAVIKFRNLVSYVEIRSISAAHVHDSAFFLDFQRSPHEQTKVERIAKTSPFVDVALIHVVAQRAEISL